MWLFMHFKENKQQQKNLLVLSHVCRNLKPVPLHGKRYGHPSIKESDFKKQLLCPQKGGAAVWDMGRDRETQDGKEPDHCPALE